MLWGDMSMVCIQRARHISVKLILSFHLSKMKSEWISGPQTGEAISLTCLTICGPSLFSETKSSLTECGMHGLGKTGWPASPGASM